MANFKSRKILYVFEFYIVCVALCQDNCQPRCWKVIPGTQIYGGSQVPNVSSEENCKDLCANNGTCVGIDWDNINGTSNYGCWFHMPTTNDYRNRSTVNHWNLVNCSDDCLTYCWKPLKNNSGVNGAQYRGTMDENRCKLLCSQTTNCTGVDWVPESNECWLINFYGNIGARDNGVHHWDIVKSQTTNCQPETTASRSPSSPPVANSTASTTPGGQTGVTGIIQNSPVIALAVLSCVFLGVSIALAVVLFRTTRLQRNQSSSSNVKEPEQQYDSLQFGNRSQDPHYEQPIN